MGAVVSWLRGRGSDTMTDGGETSVSAFRTACVLASYTQVFLFGRYKGPGACVQDSYRSHLLHRCQACRRGFYPAYSCIVHSVQPESCLAHTHTAKHVTKQRPLLLLLDTRATGQSRRSTGRAPHASRGGAKTHVHRAKHATTPSPHTLTSLTTVAQKTFVHFGALTLA